MVGWVPDEWTEGTINDTVEMITAGVSVNGEDRQINNGEFGVLKVSAVSYGFFNPLEHKAILKGELNKARVNPLSGHIMVSRANTPELVGASVLVPDDFPRLFLSDKLWQITVRQKGYDNVWLSNLLKFEPIRKKISGNATGSSKSMRNISQDAFLSISIPIPPLPEQRAIAAILRACDDTIEKTQALLTALRRRHTGLMQTLLTGKKRMKGFEGEWVELKMGDVFDRVTRKNAEQNTNVVTISAQRGFVKQNDFFKKIVASESQENYFLIRKGEFCYNKSYSNGYPKGATKRLKEFDKAVVTTLYICFALKNDNQFSGDFFEYFFEAGNLNRGLTQIAHEGGRAHGLLNVTPIDFFDLLIKVPSFKEQTVIASILQASEAETQAYEQQLSFLQQQKKGLMQILLTGQVRVKIPTEEKMD